ncbi:hypothetical protein EW146_g4375 [Bondarzewia mesenterica]|uniref:DUF7598 domain-containing protein n=1 Tax=Bondarzewia mesenterica TaxID=1095465 RepID=A0A4S4LUP8_9AGAM|nr:hypothetical protein EW146_g4375 [Bondarzewia mesenterica]
MARGWRCLSHDGDDTPDDEGRTRRHGGTRDSRRYNNCSSPPAPLVLSIIPNDVHDMNLSLLLLFVLGAQASWFGSDTPAYQTWDTAQLTTWLKEHNIPVPSGASTQQQLLDAVKSNWAAAQQYRADQYYAAQQSFQNLKDSAFDTWDESTLRQFLLDHGVVAPSGPREELVQLAKQKYREYQRTASSLSYQASTGIFGWPSYHASQSISSVIAQATAEVGRKLDESKDYVYSTWDENQLRSFLEERGLLKTRQQASRPEMLQMVHGYYVKVADPVYEAWSDSYIHDWLVEHQIYPYTSTVPPRDTLIERMRQYYYNITQKVWNTWTDFQLKQWLVDHGIVKSEAQINRDKLEKLVADNYAHAEDTVWGAWRDSDIREWLVENNHVKSREKADKMTRKELVTLINSKYNDASARTAAYLAWPDARLRAFLREHGLSEEALPTSRPGLLQEARIRYTQASTRSEAVFQRICDLLNSGIEIAEEKLHAVLDILTGLGERAMESAAENKEWVAEKVHLAKGSAESASAEATGKARKARRQLTSLSVLLTLFKNETLNTFSASPLPRGLSLSFSSLSFSGARVDLLDRLYLHRLCELVYDFFNNLGVSGRLWTTIAGADVFISLNVVRALSIVACVLVFASSIVTMVHDVEAVNRFIAAGKGSGSGSSSGNGTDLLDCDYIACAPSILRSAWFGTHARAPFCLVVITIVLVLSEIGWPARFFDRYFPVLGSDFGLGALGVIQCLIGAAVLSHHVDDFALVSAFFLFALGCLNVLLGLVFRQHAKAKRSVTSWREQAKGVLPSNVSVNVQRAASAASAASTLFGPNDSEEKGRKADRDRDRWAGYGFGRQGEKKAGLKGFLISKPVESLPRYAPPPRRASTPSVGSGPTAV